MARKIKVNKAGNIDPFSAEERDIIIKAFKIHPVYCHYAGFVEFLFRAGCRTSEAVALKWKHISVDFESILFNEAIVNVSNQRITKSTKTKRSRRLPCNDSLRSLLRERYRQGVDPNSLIFPSLTGLSINSHTFNALCWHGAKDKQGNFRPGIVKRLADEGRISHYRPQYNTRHTAITLWLHAGSPVHVVAAWVGNSPKVIYDHYCGIVPGLIPPDV